MYHSPLYMQHFFCPPVEMREMRICFEKNGTASSVAKTYAWNFALLSSHSPTIYRKQSLKSFFA